MSVSDCYDDLKNWKFLLSRLFLVIILISVYSTLHFTLVFNPSLLHEESLVFILEAGLGICELLNNV